MMARTRLLPPMENELRAAFSIRASTKELAQLLPDQLEALMAGMSKVLSATSSEKGR